MCILYRDVMILSFIHLLCVVSIRSKVMFSFVSGLESRDFGHGLYVSLARWYSEVFKAAPRRWKMVEMYENSA